MDEGCCSHSSGHIFVILGTSVISLQFQLLWEKWQDIIIPGYILTAKGRCENVSAAHLTSCDSLLNLVPGGQLCLRPLVLRDVGNSRHLSSAELSVWWSGQTGRLGGWLSREREREHTGSHVALGHDCLLSTWRHEDPLSFLLEVGSLEAEPKVPELKI